MNFWAKLFGTGKVVDGIYNGVDKIIFTKEERADHFLKILKAYEPFKILQRFLALIIGIPYMLVYITSAGLYVYGFTIDDLVHAQRVIEASKELASMNNENLGTPLAIILSFAFGGGMIEGGLRAFKNK